MAWIKWVTQVRVVERPFLGYWQARDYFRWERGLGEPILVPLSQMEVKAQIARPVNGATVPVGQAVPHIRRGLERRGAGRRAWRSRPRRRGNWRPATLLPPEARYGWRLLEYHWTPRRAGRHALRCRARDAAGNVQPETPQPDRESYVANWIVPVEVNAGHARPALCRGVRHLTTHVTPPPPAGPDSA